jgi:hypothetical protein
MKAKLFRHALPFSLLLLPLGVLLCLPALHRALLFRAPPPSPASPPPSSASPPPEQRAAFLQEDTLRSRYASSKQHGATTTAPRGAFPSWTMHEKQPTDRHEREPSLEVAAARRVVKAGLLLRAP